MAKATFSRKPVTSYIKLTGTITSKTSGAVTDVEASAILAKIVAAIDSTPFEAEELTAVVK